MTRRLASSLIVALLAAAALRAQIPASTYPARRGAALARIGGDLLIAPSRASFLADDQLGFQQAADFQYLTGLDELIGAVLVVDGSAKSSTLFVQPVNPLLTRPIVAAGAEAASRLPLSDVKPIDELEPWLRVRLSRTATKVHVAPTDARQPIKTPLPMAGSVLRWQAWLTSLGAASVMSAVDVLRPLRDIKDEAELAILRRVGSTSGKAMMAGLQALAPGRWQHESELAVLNACHAAGARGANGKGCLFDIGPVSFWPWTMSGPNADFATLWNSFVAYDHVDRQMKAGEVVRVDVGCQVDHYMGDVGRTAPVSGTFTPGQREAWDLFIAGYRAGLAHLRDGVRARAVYDEALAEIRRRSSSPTTAQGKRAAEILLGPKGTAAWELHGVGLDDAEGLPETLHAGMTVAYELMFTVDGDGFYLEDMIAIKNDGYEVLTAGLPYTAREIETSMTNRR